MNDAQLETIAENLREKGYCILPNALNRELATELSRVVKSLDGTVMSQAGVGRGSEHVKDRKVRSDSIHWIEGETAAETEWLSELEALKAYLNRRLYLGLFSVESHFAHYEPGAFYEKHRDAFRGQSNRILSLVTYLNDDWQSEWGGELLIFDEEGESVLERVSPDSGTLVIFLSEEFPHEVLPATCDRYSIASWYRVNTSNSTKVDPPV